MHTVLSVALLLASTPLVAQSSEQLAGVPEPAVLEEVLVTGEQPGPGLWRITKDDRTLWILGAYGPLPKEMTWRSREVESIVAESQRVVRWVQWDTDVDVGFFAGLAALPHMFTAGNNPDGATLKDVLPADTYEQWLWLRTVENALRDHASIMAVAPIDVLFSTNGPLAKLRERGYQVDEP